VFSDFQTFLSENSNSSLTDCERTDEVTEGGSFEEFYPEKSVESDHPEKPDHPATSDPSFFNCFMSQFIRWETHKWGGG
jgi:hypothetical protein